MSLASSILIRNVRVPCSLQILKKKTFKKNIFYIFVHFDCLF